MIGLTRLNQNDQKGRPCSLKSKFLHNDLCKQPLNLRTYLVTNTQPAARQRGDQSMRLIWKIWLAGDGLMLSTGYSYNEQTLIKVNKD